MMPGRRPSTPIVPARSIRPSKRKHTRAPVLVRGPGPGLVRVLVGVWSGVLVVPASRHTHTRAHPPTPPPHPPRVRERTWGRGVVRARDGQGNGDRPMSGTVYGPCRDLARTRERCRPVAGQRVASRPGGPSGGRGVRLSPVSSETAAHGRCSASGGSVSRRPQGVDPKPCIPRRRTLPSWVCHCK
jgi:hypothetical protein